MNNKTDEGEKLSVDALRAGDKNEIARMIERFLDPIYRLSLRMMGTPQDAEDITQETFIKAMKALPSFEGRSSLSTWLFRIAVNEALMVLRRKQPDFVYIDEDHDDDSGIQEPVQIKDWCCLPEGEMLSSESREHLDMAISRLSPNLKSVFILRDIHGFSIQETAEMLQLSEVNVKTRLLRARLKLREDLSGYFGERMSKVV